ncbi:MAG: ATP-dependent DNA helicase [Acidobacteria bacterium]|nr:ATP-dependent DNA helicase [Acidobacteriota bacterium]
MSDVPAVPEAVGLVDAVTRAFAADGPLARALPQFEPRDGQRRMALAVAETIDEGGVLMAEAGTGTGTTMAYLVPAVLSGRRVLVSTGTKNLQEQIFEKDVPALRGALGIPFTATCMKGRANYLCLHRFEEYRSRQGVRGRQLNSDDAVFLPVIEHWAPKTDTGDRAELAELPEDLALWHEVSATADTCLGSDCPRHSEGFVTRMRQRAAESDVVIVNHHLLCADAAVRESAYGEVIPSCPQLVVDEAHQLEDVATQYFGRGVSNLRIDDVGRDAEAALRAAVVAPGATAKHDASREVMRVVDHARAFFSGLALARMSRGDERLRVAREWFADHLQTGLDLAGALDGLQATCALAATSRPREAGDDGSAITDDLTAVARRAGELASDLRFLLACADPAYVYFLEVRGRAVQLRAAPIDVSRIVRDLVTGQRRATIITSATLTVEGRFDYIKERLGLEDAEVLSVPSEFDYSRQTLLYLPRRMPLPREERYTEAVAWEAGQLLRCSHGRAFVLFTSYASMRAVVQRLEPELEYPVLVQGTAPRSTLLAEFRRTPNAVLFATSSFWQGVDVQGDQLSAVIIDKLPFASPGDPIVAARIDALAAQGLSAFETYQVPLAILTLQQGLGRLIRHRNDRGVLAVLDPRIRSMGYGRRFLASLPPAPITYDMEQVRRFFGEPSE